MTKTGSLTHARSNQKRYKNIALHWAKKKYSCVSGLPKTIRISLSAQLFYFIFYLFTFYYTSSVLKYFISGILLNTNPLVSDQ